MKFEVRNRWSGNVQLDAEIECDEQTSTAVRLGLAVRWALKADANLRGADLRGANLRGADLRDADLWGADLRDADLRDADLRGADLRDADLRGADLRDADLWGADLRGANLRDANLRGAGGVADRVIDGGLRSDGYRFLLTRTDPSEWRVKAGCRNFSLTEARAHWDRTRPPGQPLGDETRLILDHMLAVAALRGWPPTGEEQPEAPPVATTETEGR